MKAEKFISELNNIPLSIKAMNVEDVTEDYLSSLINDYSVSKRHKIVRNENPLIDLVKNYEVRNLEIGLICFDEEPELINNYLFFGKLEIDDLAIDINSGKIVLIENGSNNVIYHCAENGDKFLDALILLVNFLEVRAVDDSIYDNVFLTNKLADDCANLAGGIIYFDFYKMMVGI